MLTHDGRPFSFAIARGSVDLVDAALRAHFGEDSGLLPTNRVISVRQLKSLPAFDKAEQSAILNEVDEMVLDLYGVPPADRIRLRNRDGDSES